MDRVLVDTWAALVDWATSLGLTPRQAQTAIRRKVSQRKRKTLRRREIELTVDKQLEPPLDQG